MGVMPRHRLFPYLGNDAQGQPPMRYLAPGIPEASEAAQRPQGTV
jgi:hypothetical protein